MNRQILLRSNIGFTLIEVVVAFAILLIGMLALLKSVNIGLDHNLKNQQRDEIVRIADSVMHEMRSRSFDATFTAVTSVPSKMLKMNRKYTVLRSVSDLPVNPDGELVSKQYTVTVRSVFKGYTANHAIVTVRGAQ